ncbi:MAG TPA: hypothetical protein VGT04_04125, partial [Acidobacteriaceae bacterium]|nr:hypothetical protein [Acidobacteriaceae bacterium]
DPNQCNCGSESSTFSLDKYLYADGDPVNGFDPTGRDDLVETGAKLEQSAVLTAKFTFRIAIWVVNGMRQSNASIFRLRHVMLWRYE